MRFKNRGKRGARGGTRTPTGYPIRPSNVRVYHSATRAGCLLFGTEYSAHCEDFLRVSARADFHKAKTGETCKRFVSIF